MDLDTIVWVMFVPKGLTFAKFSTKNGIHYYQNEASVPNPQAQHLLW